MILTSEWPVKQRFAGQNTEQSLFMKNILPSQNTIMLKRIKRFFNIFEKISKIIYNLKMYSGLINR